MAASQGLWDRVWRRVDRWLRPEHGERQRDGVEGRARTVSSPLQAPASYDGPSTPRSGSASMSA